MFTLHNGDCLEYMKSLAPESIQAVITDPPYGINLHPENRNGWNGKTHGRYTPIIGDDKKFDPSPFLSFKTVVLFGANYYSDLLPVGGWIIWDKTMNNKMWTPPEMAWCNKMGLMMARVLHNGVINSDSISGNNEIRYHPTQKPIVLMKLIIEKYTNEGDTIFDPFMGSGTTGIACIQTNRNFIGCEISPEYFAIAESRIKSAALQPSLFTPSNNRLHSDAGESPRQQAFFTPEADSAEGKLPTPTPRR